MSVSTFMQFIHPDEPCKNDTTEVLERKTETAISYCEMKMESFATQLEWLKGLKATLHGEAYESENCVANNLKALEEQLMLLEQTVFTTIRPVDIVPADKMLPYQYDALLYELLTELRNTFIIVDDPTIVPVPESEEDNTDA